MSRPSCQEDRQAVPLAHNVEHCQDSRPLDLVHFASARRQTMSMYEVGSSNVQKVFCYR
jgi:hypothetical protein